MATTLSLTKTVTGGTAIPANWLLTATGPTTISANGDTGVQAVTAGTYELSESGSPFGYVASAWNCGGAIMPSPTSVIVNDSGSPNVIALQVPADPTFRALLSGGRSYFHVGTNLYQVQFNAAGRLGMFKRAAASLGGAWTEAGTVNQPTGLSGNGMATVRGTTISIAYLDASNTNMRIVAFDTTTDTWGTPTVPKAMLSTLATFAFAQRSDNTYVIVAGRPNTIYYVTNTAGTWSAATVMASLASGATVLSGVIDSSDRLWALINTASSTVGIYSISAAYALGSVITSVSLLFPGLPYPYLYYPQISLWGANAVAVAWNTALTIGGAGTISVKTITPLAAPVATTSIAYTFGAGTERAFLFEPADDGSGNLNLFFVNQDLSTPRNQVKQTLFDGVSTWGATSTFYDAIANPPSSGSAAANQVINALDAVKIGSAWTAAATMRTLQPSQINTGEMLESVTPTGDVVCTITNTFGNSPFPDACIIYDNNPGGTPTFVAYDEPQELQGS